MTEPLTLGWLLTILLGVLAFVGALGVKALIQMSKDLTEIKTEVKLLVSKHDEHDRRIEKIEKLLAEEI
jgi:hypothetical protein